MDSKSKINDSRPVSVDSSAYSEIIRERGTDFSQLWKRSMDIKKEDTEES